SRAPCCRATRTCRWKPNGGHSTKSPHGSGRPTKSARQKLASVVCSPESAHGRVRGWYRRDGAAKWKEGRQAAAGGAGVASWFGVWDPSAGLTSGRCCPLPAPIFLCRRVTGGNRLVSRRGTCARTSIPAKADHLGNEWK